jgi:hypothetical protein
MRIILNFFGKIGINLIQNMDNYIRSRAEVPKLWVAIIFLVGHVMFFMCFYYLWLMFNYLVSFIINCYLRL